MKKFDPADCKPCAHMRGLVSAHVDGTLHGIAAWYTDFHIKTCGQCQVSIPFLTSLKDRLSELDAVETDPEVGDQVHQAVHEELVKIDSSVSG